MVLTVKNATGTLAGKNYLASDAEGERVIIQATSEVLRDYGEPATIEVANTKYQAGAYKIVGDNRIVEVKTPDFK